jgi:hypothetical protein
MSDNLAVGVIVEAARQLSEVELAALVSDLLDLQAVQSARWATERQTVLAEHEAGVV